MSRRVLAVALVLAACGSSSGGAAKPVIETGGQWGTAPCPTAIRVGTYQTPPLGLRTGITCSGTATILERYDPPSYSTSSAQSICATESGSTFTPG